MRCPSTLKIQSLVDGELSVAHAERVAGHLRSCPACRELAANLRATAALLQTLAEVPAPAPARGFSPAPRRPLRWQWFYLPAAACLLAAAATVTILPVFPRSRDAAFISAFVNAHCSSPAGDGLPEPCDFGLGGDWQ